MSDMADDVVAAAAAYPWWSQDILNHRLGEKMKFDDAAKEAWRQICTLAKKKIEQVHQYIADHRRPPFLQTEKLMLENVICHVYQVFVDNLPGMIPVVLRVKRHIDLDALAEYIRAQMKTQLVVNAHTFLLPLNTFARHGTLEDGVIERFLHEAAGPRMQPIAIDEIMQNILLDNTAIRFDATTGSWIIHGDSCPRRLDAEGQYQEALTKILAAERYHALLHTADIETAGDTNKPLEAIKTTKREKTRKKAAVSKATGAWLMNLFGIPSSTVILATQQQTPMFITMTALLDVVVPGTLQEDRQAFVNGIVTAIQRCPCTDVRYPDLSCFDALIEETRSTRPALYRALQKAGFNFKPSGGEIIMTESGSDVTDD
jgi:hypothetical protein